MNLNDILKITYKEQEYRIMRYQWDHAVKTQLPVTLYNENGNPVTKAPVAECQITLDK